MRRSSWITIGANKAPASRPAAPPEANRLRRTAVPQFRSVAGHPGCICRSCRRGKLRREIAVEDRRAAMAEAALKVGPDFAADIGPAFAEGKILAQISPAVRIDHAF